MHRIEIYKLNNDGSQSIICVCKLVDGRIVCEGENKIFIENLEKDGIIDYSSKNYDKLYFKDGFKFLEQLKYNFKSGYLNASDVLKN